jgi:hypothetical protein
MVLNVADPSVNAHVLLWSMLFMMIGTALKSR